MQLCHFSCADCITLYFFKVAQDIANKREIKKEESSKKDLRQRLEERRGQGQDQNDARQNNLEKRREIVKGKEDLRETLDRMKKNKSNSGQQGRIFL